MFSENQNQYRYLLGVLLGKKLEGEKVADCLSKNKILFLLFSLFPFKVVNMAPAIELMHIIFLLRLSQKPVDLTKKAQNITAVIVIVLMINQFC